jgi:hypothetical protein
MGAADFLLAPEVQKLLQLVFSRPDAQFTARDIAKACKLDVDDVERTQEHLVRCGILTRCKSATDETAAVRANPAFIFYSELRSIALKSFAAAEPVRAMLRSKFRRSVLRAYLLGEDLQGTVELLVVHGREVPDEEAMSAACRKLSASMGRHLQVHVISGQKFVSLSARDELGRKLASASALELIAEGDTKAKQALESEGLLEMARKRLAALAR